MSGSAVVSDFHRRRRRRRAQCSASSECDVSPPIATYSPRPARRHHRHRIRSESSYLVTTAPVSTHRPMVSQSTSSPQKAPSYADLAKKAQNTRAPIAPPPPNPPPTESPSPSSPNTLKIIDPHNDAPLDSLAPTPTDAPDEPAKTSSLNDLATKALSVVAAHTAPQKNPIVNFWDARKEQMAAARTAQQQPNSHPTTLQNTLHDKSTSTEARSPSKTTAPTKQFASNGSYPGSGPSAGTPNNTRHTGARPVDDDPFVIRISPKPPIPPAIDADSWPEVGKPVSSAHLGGPPVTGESNHPQHEANKIDHPPQIAQSHSRKSKFHVSFSFLPLQFFSSNHSLMEPSCSFFDR